MARLSEHGIRLSSMSPSFLNSNSTSHTWPFSAVAELIDNASDPGVSAKQIWIDVSQEAGYSCLSFTDNGSGMTPNKLHKMLSFGFTDKGTGKASLQAIGVYGNGFKSGSMRLGRDALIFTKNGGCQTVGLLSQTYLEAIKAQAVIVPIVPFNQQTKSLVVTEDSEASLAAILQYSIITSQEQIQSHFDSIASKKGTKILIWNTRKAKDGKPELDLESDEGDIRLPEIQIEELKKSLKSTGALKAEQSIPDLHYSLRAYLSILYLKPRTQIILRGKKILASLVAKRLIHIEHDVYKPHFSKEKVKVTFGLTRKNKDYYGIMMYHKNRLIKAYEKVGCQLKTSGQRVGVGVIGVIECNFLKPAHNKQDFEYTKEYRLTLGALGLKLNDYWRELTQKKAREREFHSVNTDDEDEESKDSDEAPMWLQCEECLKWRSVPAGLYNAIPDSWNCSQNPNPRYRSCSSREETEESEELLTPSYQKNHKKQENPRTRKREKSLELCEEQDQASKHHTLSRSSSEPAQPTDGSARTPQHTGRRLDRHQEKNTHDDERGWDWLASNDERTDGGVTLTNKEDKACRQEADGNTDKGPKTLFEDNGNSQPKDSKLESAQINGGSADPFSPKRKLGSAFYCVQKRPYPWTREQAESGSTTEELHPETRTNMPKRWSPERDWQDRGHREVNQFTPTTLDSRSPPPPEGADRESSVQRLAKLEREAQSLRRLLGLENAETMPAPATSPQRWTKRTKERAAAAATKDIGCQTSAPEGTTLSSGPALTPGHQGMVVPHTVYGSNRSKKNESERERVSRVRDTDSEGYGCEDSRSVQDDLHSIRNNVVVLLTSLLPQLDLTGISFDTPDVDNILQQIIEVNSLKL